MKKGRPAHTLTALVPQPGADAVRTEIFRQTSTIGLRETPGRQDRPGPGDADGARRRPRVHVKLALHDGRVVNVQPEYEDVVRVAR